MYVSLIKKTNLIVISYYNNKLEELNKNKVNKNINNSYEKMEEKRSLLKKREELKPFEYPEFEERANSIINTHWVHSEVNFSRDKHEFLVELNDIERYIIGTILKTFAQTETYVSEDFWATLPKYLPKPEIALVSATFSENEWRHAMSYDKLNSELELTDYKAFLQDDISSERFRNILSSTNISFENNTEKPNVEDLLVMIAVFGGFTEYVNLFSQFAILRSFSSNNRNMLINIGEIIDWSALDEQHHADTALYIFNLLKEENPEHWNHNVKSRILEAAKLTYEIEEKLIYQIFKLGNLPNLSKQQLLNFTKNRINTSLVRMGLYNIYDIDTKLLEEMRWFEDGLNSNSHADFFAKRVTDYTKNLVIYDKDSVRADRDVVKSLSNL